MKGFYTSCDVPVKAELLAAYGTESEVRQRCLKYLSG